MVMKSIGPKLDSCVRFCTARGTLIVHCHISHARDIYSQNNDNEHRESLWYNDTYSFKCMPNGIVYRTLKASTYDLAVIKAGMVRAVQLL